MNRVEREELCKIKPLISILVPVYKVPEKMLRKCIESLINQTLSEIEIIIVDDGSPDDCGSICDEYAQRDSRIRVIHKENQGLSSARNTAYMESTGKYITFLDGDDYFSDDACQIAYAEAEKENADCVFWNYVYEYNFKSVPTYTFANEKIVFEEEKCKMLQERVLKFDGEFAQVFTKLIKREVLEQNNIKHIDSLKQGAEGLVFNVLLFEYVKKAVYIPNFLYHYIYNDKSITHSHNVNNYYMILDCFDYIIQFSRKNGNENNLEKLAYTRLLYVVCTTAISGYFNPENRESFKRKIDGFSEFLNADTIKNSLTYGDVRGLDLKRKLVIYLIKTQRWIIIDFLARMRRMQLHFK